MPIGRTIAAKIAGAALIALTAFPAPPASAQGLFDFLFGNVRRSAPVAAPSYADPGFDQRAEQGAPREYGPHVAYCVRSCDGRFFPIQHHAGATPAELCKSFCPAAQTKIYSGSGIAHAVSGDGKRYADMPNAFAYRDRIVSGCTCNGKDALGLEKLDAGSDPTLRPGDMVATNDGLLAYRGSRKGEAQFTPVNREHGRKVSAVKPQRAGDNAD